MTSAIQPQRQQSASPADAVQRKDFSKCSQLIRESSACTLRPMPEDHAAFVGSIPENYDRYLGPVFIQPNARELVARLDVSPGADVLELDCGTGIVTRSLRDALPADAKLTATDLNPPMMNYAAAKFDSGEAVEWRQADAS